MLKLRTDTKYVTPDGKLTQAGVEAFQGLLDAQAASIAALEAIAISSAPGAAPRYACRAWVNFNGTGTPAIRASANVASITDNDVGDYTINFTTAMPDANYSVVMSYSSEVNVQHGIGFIQTVTASSVRVQFYNAANSVDKVDKSVVCIAIFR